MNFDYFNQLPYDLQREILSSNPDTLYRSAFLNRQLNSLTENNRRIALCSKSLTINPLTGNEYFLFFKTYPNKFSIFHFWKTPYSRRVWSINKYQEIDKTKYEVLDINLNLTNHKYNSILTVNPSNLIAKAPNGTYDYKYNYFNNKNNDIFLLDLFSQYHIFANIRKCGLVAKTIIQDNFEQTVNSYKNNQELLYGYLLNNASVETIQDLNLDGKPENISEHTIDILYDTIRDQIKSLP